MKNKHLFNAVAHNATTAIDAASRHSEKHKTCAVAKIKNEFEHRANPFPAAAFTWQTAVISMVAVAVAVVMDEDEDEG